MKTKGVCKYCQESFTGGGMSRHLPACPDRKKENKKEDGDERIFLIKAGVGPYWVYFEANTSNSLKDIDNFLRSLWVECCWHLSVFEIGGLEYVSNPQPEYGDKNMDVVLDEVLGPGFTFMYEYDFGTPTRLKLKCVSERTGNTLSNIEVLARNDKPDLRCKCGKEAEEICTQCVWEKGEGAFFCSKCAKKHECDEEMFLPFVNSPRTGMCGYTGEM